MNRKKSNALLVWLLACLATVLLMIAVGGVTRLTRSGLSITEWRPITGIVPPLTQEAWTREFDLYKRSPEFRHVNSHFELSDYKKIFWWEFLHRALGRVIFLMVVAGCFVFRRRREVSRRFALGLPALILVQGLMGWLMVKSGLTHRPAVSHYMLAVHFFLALVTLVALYQQIIRFKQPLGVRLSGAQAALVRAVGALYLVQLLYGCFTSGLKAGLYFNTYPLMNGQVLPPEAQALVPWARNFVENPVMVQWIHRWLGTLTLFATLFLVFHGIRSISPRLTRPLLHLGGVVVTQFALGVSALLFGVPLWIAAAHQVMAALLVLGYFNLTLRLEAPSAESRRPNALRILPGGMISSRRWKHLPARWY